MPISLNMDEFGDIQMISSDEEEDLLVASTSSQIPSKLSTSSAATACNNNDLPYNRVTFVSGFNNSVCSQNQITQTNLVRSQPSEIGFSGLRKRPRENSVAKTNDSYVANIETRKAYNCRQTVLNKQNDDAVHFSETDSSKTKSQQNISDSICNFGAISPVFNSHRHFPKVSNYQDIVELSSGDEESDDDSFLWTSSQNVIPEKIPVSTCQQNISEVLVRNKMSTSCHENANTNEISFDAETMLPNSRKAQRHAIESMSKESSTDKLNSCDAKLPQILDPMRAPESHKLQNVSCSSLKIPVVLACCCNYPQCSCKKSRPLITPLSMHRQVFQPSDANNIGAAVVSSLPSEPQNCSVLEGADDLVMTHKRDSLSMKKQIKSTVSLFDLTSDINVNKFGHHSHCSDSWDQSSESQSILGNVFMLDQPSQKSQSILGNVFMLDQPSQKSLSSLENQFTANIHHPQVHLSSSCDKFSRQISFSSESTVNSQPIALNHSRTENQSVERIHSVEGNQTYTGNKSRTGILSNSCVSVQRLSALLNQSPANDVWSDDDLFDEYVSSSSDKLDPQALKQNVPKELGNDLQHHQSQDHRNICNVAGKSVPEELSNDLVYSKPDDCIIVDDSDDEIFANLTQSFMNPITNVDSDDDTVNDGWMDDDDDIDATLLDIDESCFILMPTDAELKNGIKSEYLKTEKECNIEVMCPNNENKHSERSEVNSKNECKQLTGSLDRHMPSFKDIEVFPSGATNDECSLTSKVQKHQKTVKYHNSESEDDISIGELMEKQKVKWNHEHTSRLLCQSSKKPDIISSGLDKILSQSHVSDDESDTDPVLPKCAFLGECLAQPLGKEIQMCSAAEILEVEIDSEFDYEPVQEEKIPVAEVQEIVLQTSESKFYNWKSPKVKQSFKGKKLTETEKYDCKYLKKGTELFKINNYNYLDDDNLEKSDEVKRFYNMGVEGLSKTAFSVESNTTSTVQKSAGKPLKHKTTKALPLHTKQSVSVKQGAKIAQLRQGYQQQKKQMRKRALDTSGTQMDRGIKRAKLDMLEREKLNARENNPKNTSKDIVEARETSKSIKSHRSTLPGTLNCITSYDTHLPSIIDRCPAENSSVSKLSSLPNSNVEGDIAQQSAACSYDLKNEGTSRSECHRVGESIPCSKTTEHSSKISNRLSTMTDSRNTSDLSYLPGEKSERKKKVVLSQKDMKNMGKNGKRNMEDIEKHGKHKVPHLKESMNRDTRSAEGYSSEALLHRGHNKNLFENQFLKKEQAKDSSISKFSNITDAASSKSHQTQKDCSLNKMQLGDKMAHVSEAILEISRSNSSGEHQFHPPALFSSSLTSQLSTNRQKLVCSEAVTACPITLHKSNFKKQKEKEVEGICKSQSTTSSYTVGRSGKIIDAGIVSKSKGNGKYGQQEHTSNIISNCGKFRKKSDKQSFKKEATHKSSIECDSKTLMLEKHLERQVLQKVGQAVMKANDSVIVESKETGKLNRKNPTSSESDKPQLETVEITHRSTSKPSEISGSADQVAKETTESLSGDVEIPAHCESVNQIAKDTTEKRSLSGEAERPAQCEFVNQIAKDTTEKRSLVGEAERPVLCESVSENDEVPLKTDESCFLKPTIRNVIDKTILDKNYNQRELNLINSAKADKLPNVFNLSQAVNDSIQKTGSMQLPVFRDVSVRTKAVQQQLSSIREPKIHSVSGLHSRTGSLTDLPKAKVDNRVCLTQDSLLSSILSWNTVWMKEYVTLADSSKSLPPIVKLDKLYPLLDTYDNYSDYVKIQQPLFILELWESMVKKWKDSGQHNQKSLMVIPTYLDIKKEQHFMFLYCQALVSQQDLSYEKHPKESDLVIVSLKAFELPQKGKPVDPSTMVIKPVFGFVKRVQRCIPGRKVENENQGYVNPKIEEQKKIKGYKSAVINFVIQILYRKQPIDSNEFISVTVVTSILSNLRQFSGLANLPKNPLSSEILRPYHQEVFHHNLPIGRSQLKEKFNPIQSDAISRISKAVLDPYYPPKICLLQGPPGTGKSHTIIGILENMLTQSKNLHILLCAPSNAGIDELCRRLIAHNHSANSCNGGRRAISFVRLGNVSSIHQAVVSFSLQALAKERFEKSQTAAPGSVVNTMNNLKKQQQEWNLKLEKMLLEKKNTTEIDAIKREIAKLESRKEKITKGIIKPMTISDEKKMKKELLMNVDVVCTTLNHSGSLLITEMLQQDDNKVHFGCIIVDEACQCTELDCLIPLQYRASKLILVGDPEQLPPTVLSKKAADMNYGQSLFERLYNQLKSAACSGHQGPVLMLQTQYRMHPDICQFPSKHFYGSLLKTDPNTAKKRCQFAFSPFAVFDLNYTHEQIQNGSSPLNQGEADFIIELCQHLASRMTVQRAQQNIGIITPYQSQRALVVNLMKQRCPDLQSIEVGTVDGFQGREKDVIIFSCVRANASQNIGFLDDRRRMNVSVTRAKYALYTVGNMKTLKDNSDWLAFINDAEQHNRLIKVDSAHLSADKILRGCIKS